MEYKSFLTEFHEKGLTDKKLKLSRVLLVAGLILIGVSLISVEMFKIEYLSTQHYILATETLLGLLLTMYSSMFILCKAIFEIKTRKNVQSDIIISALSMAFLLVAYSLPF